MEFFFPTQGIPIYLYTVGLKKQKKNEGNLASEKSASIAQNFYLSYNLILASRLDEQASF